MIKIKFVRVNYGIDPYRQIFYKYSPDGVFTKEFSSIETAAKFLKQIEDSKKIKVYKIYLPAHKIQVLINKIRHL